MDKHTKLYVVKEKEFNAFALPDNSIFVFSGVFDKLKSYEELAALLGHEYSHIKHRHGIKGLAEAGSYELITLFVGANNENDLSKIAVKLITFKNSRKFENEADEGGLDILEQKHVDLNGMSNLFQTMENLPEVENNRIPSFLSTHPDIEERSDNIENAIKNRVNKFSDHSKLEVIFEELKEKETPNYDL